MTYLPQVFSNNYYGSANITGIDSVPRQVCDSVPALTFGASTTPLIAAITPQINLFNLKYIDFYGYIDTSGTAPFRWSIQQANPSTGAIITNGMTKSTGTTVTSITMSSYQSMTDTSLAFYTWAFTDAFNLYQNQLYYIFCERNSTAATNTNYILGASMSIGIESLYSLTTSTITNINHVPFVRIRGV